MHHKPGLIKVTIVSDGHFRQIEIPLTGPVMIYAPNGTGKTGAVNAIQYLLLEYQKMDGHDSNDSKEHYFPKNRGWVIGYFDTETGHWTGAVGLRDGKLTRIIAENHLPLTAFRHESGQCKTIEEIEGDDIEDKIQEAKTWGEWEDSLAGRSEKIHNIALFPTSKSRKRKASPLSTILCGLLQKNFDDDKMRKILVEILGDDVEDNHGSKILASREKMRAKIREINKKKTAADKCQTTANSTADVPKSSEKLKMFLNGHIIAAAQKQTAIESLKIENGALYEAWAICSAKKTQEEVKANKAREEYMLANANLESHLRSLREEQATQSALEGELMLFTLPSAEKEVELLRTQISDMDSKLGKTPQELQGELSRRQIEKERASRDLIQTQQDLLDIIAGRIHPLTTAWKTLTPKQKTQVGSLLGELESQGKSLNFPNPPTAQQFLEDLGKQIHEGEGDTLEWMPNQASARYAPKPTPTWLESGKTQPELEDEMQALKATLNILEESGKQLRDAIDNRKAAEAMLERRRDRKSELERLMTRYQKLEQTKERIIEISKKLEHYQTEALEKVVQKDTTETTLATAKASLELANEDLQIVKAKIHDIEKFFVADSKCRHIISKAAEMVKSYPTDQDLTWNNHEEAFGEVASLMNRLQGQQSHLRSTAEEAGCGFAEDEEIWVTWNNIKDIGDRGEEEREKERQLKNDTKKDVEAYVTEALERFSTLKRRVAEFSRTQLDSQPVSNITSVKIECESRDPQWINLLKRFRTAANHDNADPLFAQGEKDPETLMEEVWEKIEQTDSKESKDALSLDYLCTIVFETTNGSAPPKRRNSIKGESTGTQMTLRGLILSGLLREQTGPHRGKIPLLVDEINTVDENNQDILKECCEKIGLVPIVAGPTLPAGFIDLIRVNLENNEGGVVSHMQTQIVIIEKCAEGGTMATDESAIVVEAI